ncbi:MAG TPA: alpha-L-fucosidase [Bryobacteraceae bacterium]|nr:alpha-L-fucosidase [Bryobacteraceae bacterium]
MTRRSMLALSAAAALRPLRADDPPYQPAPGNLRAREWFQDAKFGLFIHWGVYSVLGKGEWVMNNTGMSVRDYEKLPPQFNPVKYDAAQWVALAKQAGMRYITITSKHHDGFAMFGTRQSKWNIVDATPYGKDVLKPLSEECRRQGVHLFFYHSHLDWHHPDYFPLGRTGHTAGRPEGGDFNRYLDYMDAQLTELLTGYGDVAGIWFDGIWDKRGADWRLRRTYDLIHKLQPAAMAGNNHHLPPFAGEDFQMFEKDLPGGNTAGFNSESKIGNLPLETCETINGAWGYNSEDHNYKSTRQLVHYLAKAAGNNANFLLNIGPKPDGTIQEEFRTRLTEVGSWLAKNGESIYGTRGGPIAPRPWGVTTQKGSRTYVHVLDWQDELLALPRQSKAPKTAALLGSGRPVKMQAVEDGLLLHLPKEDRDPIDTVVVLES